MTSGPRSPFLRHVRRGLPSLVLGVLALASAGCNKRVQLPLVSNQRPLVSLTQAPVGGSTKYFYSYEMRWSGFDPDGRVDHYIYAVDPPTATHAETSWVQTRDNRKTFQFASWDPDSAGTKEKPGGYHVFVIKAVDNQGLESEPVWRAFDSYTIAPDVRIVNPQPSHLIFPLVPPTVVVTWTGHDVDGVHTLKPVQYKFKLFKEGGSELDLLTLALNPDTLRRLYGPRFPTWDSTATDTFTTLHDLVPGSRYLFVVVAFDEAGAYTPIFNFDLNMLYFTVSFIGNYGPAITMYNDSFTYSYPTGGYWNDPTRYVFIEAASTTPVSLFWYATPAAYTVIKQYRWAMDIEKLDDDTPRSGPNDTKHWSFPALSTTSATVGPFTNPADSLHNFFIEAEDNNGLKSLGIISIRVVRPTFQNQLLFVNDTRFALDQGFGTDSLRTAIGEWPCEAELDTFFYARGGVRWKFYPPGTLSSPGIFSGYPMDTVLTTRLNGDLVPLSLLAKYQHVVWFSNATAAFGVYLPSLQYMSGPGHSNSLATYVRMGGKAWLMGGGGARATLLPVNSRTNDVGGATVFSPSLNELVPGRFMYDLVHWQSEISALVSIFANRNPLLPNGPGAPDYSGLPAQLRYRTEAADPIPPFRGAEFYPIGYDAEYLSKPNKVTEQVRVTDDSSYTVSVLDTLYYTNGTSLGSKPVMTVYRGHDNPPFVFSGFPLWYFSRAQAMAVGDWVLNTFWGIPRADLPRDPATAAAAARARQAPRP